jgi:hypothetical protein
MYDDNRQGFAGDPEKMYLCGAAVVGGMEDEYLASWMMPKEGRAAAV